MTKIAVNLRFTAHQVTGTQRYARELVARFGKNVTPIQPRTDLTGTAGHSWEQFMLPARLGKRLLWSPVNTGPLAVRSQVLTVHDLSALDHPSWFSASFASWYGWLLPRLMQRVQHIVAVSAFTRTRILERTGINASKVSVVPNGVDAAFRPRSPEEVEISRAAAGIPSRHFLLCVGSLEPRKNLKRLMAAWQQIQSKIPEEIWLVIVGMRGRSKVFGDAGIEELPPRAHLAGFVDEKHLPGLYSGALALVYPSLYEGFGLPPLEAMSCGCPVVTSDRTSLPEVVGDAALLADPYQVDSIAERMQTVVEKRSVREALRTKGLERAKEFSWNRTTTETWKLLESTCQRVCLN